MLGINLTIQRPLGSASQLACQSQIINKNVISQQLLKRGPPTLAIVCRGKLHLQHLCRQSVRTAHQSSSLLRGTADFVLISLSFAPNRLIVWMFFLVRSTTSVCLSASDKP